MSSTVRSYSYTISSVLMPAARWPRMSATGMRVPLMTASPPSISLSETIPGKISDDDIHHLPLLKSVLKTFCTILPKLHDKNLQIIFYHTQRLVVQLSLLQGGVRYPQDRALANSI